jgi:hypothetical protein
MKTAICCVLLAVASMALPVANFSGKWAIQNPGGRGRGGATIVVLNQTGTEVTGTFGQRIDNGSGSPVGWEVLGGKVEGDTISFYIWTGVDEPVKQLYKGTLSGDEITFAVTGGAASKVVARRVK